MYIIRLLVNKLYIPTKEYNVAVKTYGLLIWKKYLKYIIK